MDDESWLTVDAAFADQMAERARLLAQHPDAVIACLPQAEQAALELLEHVLAMLSDRADFTVGPDTVQRPDGQSVSVDRARPLHTLGHIITEDLCILQKDESEHVLTAALLCFPASWSLDEKIGRPMTAVHGPVREYDPALAARVQRLFDGVQVGRPIWRANLLQYADPALFQPRRENDPRNDSEGDAAFERSEKQVLFRLPDTGAVVFTIHTTVARRSLA